MHKIELKALQMPKIFLDGKSIVFPYKKTEALFYYIAIEKIATRDIVSTLLWEDTITETARKNLRHALYIVKKTCGFEVITSSQNSTLILHPDIEFTCDVDELLEKDQMDTYHADFLQGFSLKNASMFEEWVERKREQLRNRYLIKCYDHIVSLPYDQLSEIELHYAQYMEIDPFDERVSIAMMKAYQKNKLYLKGIKIYEKLHKELGNELGIIPGQEINNLYRELRMEWAETSALEPQEETHFVNGRSAEATLLRSIYQIFLNGSVHAIQIDGENGIGKTYLINHFLDSIRDDNVFLLNASCYSAEKNTPLYPWNSLVFQMEDFILEHQLVIPKAYIQAVAQFFPTFINHPIDSPTIALDIANSFNFRAVQNGIYRILSQICEHTPVLIILENFHFSDTYSRQLLSVLFHELHQNFMVIFTCLDTLDSTANEFFSSLQKDNLLSQVHLNRFSKEDTKEMILSALETADFEPSVLDTIFEETKGNPFFINELLTTYKERGTIEGLSFTAQNILTDRLNGLSVESRQILDIISLFHNHVTLDLLESLLDRNSLDILAHVEELKIRSLIEERSTHGTIHFLFTHNKMREFVQSRIAPSKQKVLHNSIGYALERILSSKDPTYYTQLVYHFTLGGNPIKVITYQIYPFEDLSITMFELYPSLFNSLDPLKAENLSERFITLEENLEVLQSEFHDEAQYQELHARLLIAKGRYYILSGLYCDGLISIKKTFQMPYVKNNPSYLLKSMRQMVYYSIQLCQLSLMEEYVEKGLELARSLDFWFELALFYRLKGLYYMMLNQYEDCKVCLEQSITLLETHHSFGSTSIINIAASYNYFGEMERRQKNFDIAITHYQHAISLCTEHNVSINSTFYTNLGCAYWGKGNKAKAYKSFFTASELYDNSFTLMGRSIAKEYCAIFYSEYGDFKKAAEYLSVAENAVKQLGSPLEKGLLRRTQAELKYRFPKGWEHHLTEPLSFYCQDCERLLKPLGIYEVDDVTLYQS